MNNLPSGDRSQNSKNIGKNIILSFCNKKHVIGIPESAFLVITFSALITVTYIVWSVFLFHFVHISLFIIVSFLYVLVILNYLFCFLKEPGIIPRNCPLYPIEEVEQIKINADNKEEIKEENNNKHIEINNDTNNSKEIKKKEESDTPRIYTSRKCETCNINRPPKSSHCSICDNCVKNFDQYDIY